MRPQHTATHGNKLPHNATHCNAPVKIEPSRLFSGQAPSGLMARASLKVPVAVCVAACVAVRVAVCVAVCVAVYIAVYIAVCVCMLQCVSCSNAVL